MHWRIPYPHEKGGIILSSIGYLQVRTYTSAAELPLKDVAIAVSSSDGTAIAFRLSDRSGRTPRIEIPVPNREESLEPNFGEEPYTSVSLYAYKKGYEQIIADDVQIFADTTTYQDFEMIPLPDGASPMDDIIHYHTPPQDL